MNCPGSVELLRRLDLPETDEPDYRREGTAAHEVAAGCLRTDVDAWEVVGEKANNGELVTAEMADAVQVYLDTCRPLMVPHGKVYIERQMTSPRHALMYGTVDFAVVADSLLNIVDYKHGVGVVVEVEDNPQLKYYAYLVLQDHPDVRRVVLRVVQPRAFHPDGPVRRWEATAEAITEWVESELVPAMNAVEVDHALDAGPWCRFCPAKLVCPLMTGLFGAAANASASQVVAISDASIGREYQYAQAVKHYLKALEAEVFRRLNSGKAVPGTKLVNKRADRVWREGAEDVLREQFGGEAWTVPRIKSPPQIEELAGSVGKKFTKEWAYTPQTGLTVALESDKRPVVRVQTTTEAFGAAVAALETEAEVET